MFLVAAALFWFIGANAPAAFLGHFTVFVLACFVGYMVVWNVTPALHTPLMSVTNAISSIIAIGALVQVAPLEHRGADGRPTGWILGLAVVAHRAHRHQHVRRLRGHAAHAADVPEVGREHMSPTLATVAYLGATILFILSLGGLSNPENSRRGNLYGMIGMAIAVLATVLGPQVTKAGYPVDHRRAWPSAALIGLYAARAVKMTQMPELVALMHSLVGLAAVLVGFANYIDPAASAGFQGAEKTIHQVEIYVGILIGAVTFSGSVIAFGKLSAQDQRQADAAARPPLDQPRRPAGGALVRRAGSSARTRSTRACCRSW